MQHMDDMLMSILREYKEKTLRSAIDGDLELEDTAADETGDTHSESFTFLKEALGEEVDEIRVSKKLKTHPVCLGVTGPITLEMEKYFAQMPGDEAQKPKAQRVLELNADHPVFEKLKGLYEKDREKAEKLTRVLYAQATLIAGLPIDDPAEYTELICELI